MRQAATGAYIYSSAADDRVLPGFFQKSMELLLSHPEAGLCSGLGRLIDASGKDRGINVSPVISKTPRYLTPAETRRQLTWSGSWIVSYTVIYRRDAVEVEGGLIGDLGSYADNFASLVISLRHGACYIPELLSCWRQMSTGYSTQNLFNWERLFQQLSLASELMRTRFSDLFPADYVRRFERHSKYTVNVVANIHAGLVHDEIRRQAYWATRPEFTWFDRMFWAGIRSLMRLQSLAFRLYSMVEFGPLRWWFIGRLSVARHFRRVVMTTKYDVRPPVEIVSKTSKD